MKFYKSKKWLRLAKLKTKWFFFFEKKKNNENRHRCFQRVRTRRKQTYSASRAWSGRFLGPPACRATMIWFTESTVSTVSVANLIAQNFVR